MSITINNPDNGTYALIFRNPSTLLYTKSDPIPANANANTVYSTIYSYYSKTFGSGISVTL